MANEPALSTAKGGKRNVESKFMDVLEPNQGEGFDPNLTEQTERNFYKGAPPNWFNFQISDQAESGGPGTAIIKRDGYETLKKQIQEKRKLPGISTVKLFHQSGCGGTTLAMQVLWDFRKTFRCAVFSGSTSDTTMVTDCAKQVVDLYKGSRGYQNTVLLLVEGDQKLENLPDSILEECANQKIDIHVYPVVILLQCIRKNDLVIKKMEEQSMANEQKYVIIKKNLSDREKQEFAKKEKELRRRYGDECQQFHGFNIIQTNFSQSYIQEACEIFRTIKRSKRPLKNQLVAFLSLLNAYVPGSYLLESQCQEFLKDEDNVDGSSSLEEEMNPFSPFLVTFYQNTREKKVRMVHPMIAKCCTELMAEAGVTRSDTARNFLTWFGKDDVPPFLLSFIKDMLTKREEKINPRNDAELEQEKFSSLILDISQDNREGGVQSASVLKVASNKFQENPFFPQALARFLYIELKEYDKAERWAKTAMKRDPKNSFVADTLGQVHKNHLKNTTNQNPREMLNLAKKAINAFKHEQQLSEDAQDLAEVSSFFNCRGQFGYLQVCNILYDKLVELNDTWREVLTKKVSMCSVLTLLGDKKLYRFNDLIRNLTNEVQKRCDFFDTYLTYSKPNKKDDPAYISADTTDCYRNYVGHSRTNHTQHIQKLREKHADTSVGILSSFVRGHTVSDLQEIKTWWEKICSRDDSISALVNYIFSHIMLINTATVSLIKDELLTTFEQKMRLKQNNRPEPEPEMYILALLLFWPENTEDTAAFDLRQLIQKIHSAYDQVHKTHFRSRYLRPLFFLGKGQGLNRIIHRDALELLFSTQNDDEIPDWQSEIILKNQDVKDHLLKVNGMVRDYKVYTTVGAKEIEVEANWKNSIWKPRLVSFYLGFTIRGPVAFGIQNRTEVAASRQNSMVHGGTTGLTGATADPL